LGVQIRHSTPLHPESNSSIERVNACLKKLLHHVALSPKPNSWHEKLPTLLWAIRDAPNSSTGLSPHQLTYGRVGRGPLAVLRDSWTGKSEEPPASRQVQEYLDILRNDLEVASQIAIDNCKSTQKAYVDKYNVGTHEKNFQVGDEVLVLLPTSTNALKTEWQGPALVTAVISDHSYRLALPNGSVRKLHANLLRRYVPRITSIGVVHQDDAEFGKVITYPSQASDFETNVSSIDTTHLSPDQKSELLIVLRRNSSVFNDKPGVCNVTQHEIKLREGVIPRPQRPYRIPESLKAEVQRQVSQLLEDGKIRESSSPFAHPVVCVTKKTGEVRLCTDLRYVNSFTVVNNYPMPRVDELIYTVSGANFVSLLDNTAGYWQIPITPEDQYKTAFVTPQGHYEWLFMPFGLVSAGNTYQACMDKVLRPHSVYASAYIDDTAVHSKTWRLHLQHLENVLRAFQAAGMTLKLRKCKFGLSQVKFVGHIVGSGTRRPCNDKIQAILEIPEPATPKQLRSFLGICNYYREYVPDYSKIAVPLTEMTRPTQGKKIVFSDAQRSAFMKLKQQLGAATLLYTPDPQKPYLIFTDSSDFAVGAVLAQEFPDSVVPHPIAFASAKLSQVQSRWSTIERESFGIIFSLRKFDYLIYGKKIVLYTDHNPLTFLTASAPHSSKLMRWALALSRYDITISYIKGKFNCISDFLSRNIAS
jgi:hypothetical protein